MKKRFLWLRFLGLALFLIALPLAPTLAGEAEKKAESPAMRKAEPAAPAKPAMAEQSAGHMGTIVAVVPASRTLVVDILLGKQVLRVGAEVTAKTKIEAAGTPRSLESLKSGARVRINFRRVATGDEAISVELLGSSKS
jgi:hypothetical protein